MARKDFYIARIEEDKESPKNKEVEDLIEPEKKFQPTRFVSSYFGTKVKDTPSFPYIKYGNKGSQYEGLRDQRQQSDEDLIERYGTKFYEFKQIQGIKDGNNTPQDDEGFNQEKDEYEYREEYSEKTKEIPSYLRRDDYSGKRQSNYNDPRTTKKDEVRVSNSTQGSFHQNQDYNKTINDEQDRNEYDFYDSTIYQRGNDQGDNRDIRRDIDSPRVSPVESRGKTRNRQESKIVENHDTRHLKPSNLVKARRSTKYIAPPLNLVKMGETLRVSDYSSVNYQKEIIDRTLKDFRLGGRVVHYTKGPAVTQFEIKLDPGVKVERVKNIAKNLQMNLEGKSIRIEAPIPGKSTIGIEVPNIVQDKVMFGDLITREEFLKDGNPLNVALGIDISGDFVTLDITSMPHALIAGTTGSGKSVCINTIINSIIYKATPEQVRLILIDPKLIEFASYEDIPHLATPVINDPKLATTALKWVVDEMENRYQLFKAYRKRDITSFNDFAKDEPGVDEIPFIVVIIDELADLMFIASSTVEEYIQRLAQKARAAGIHLIMATQRPSTDVIKGSIKANIQTRIAFQVNSQVDSMTILDKSGADKLLGKGDMLYSDGVTETRVQGAFISLDEINDITDDIRNNNGLDFMFSKEDLEEKMERDENQEDDPREDEFFPVIANYVVENDNASINRIQKKFGIGFNRAQAIMRGLEDLGIVSDGVAGKQRSVLVTHDELDEILND